MKFSEPKYLEEIAEIEKTNSSFIVLNIKCPCGCSQFNLYRNVKNSKQDKEWQEWEQRLSKWGKIETILIPLTESDI